MIAIFQPDLDGAFRDWAYAAAGSLYLGLPAFAAIALRRGDGTIDAEWLHDLAGWASLGWDAAPRGLAWRTAARAAGVLGLLVAWLLAVERAGDSLFGHQGEVALQGVAGVISASAWVTWRRTAGEACPGIRLALGVVPLVTAWSLVRPFSEAVPVFPYAVGGGDLGDWDTSRVAWQVFAVAAAVLLAAALAEVRWWWVRSPRSVDSGP